MTRNYQEKYINIICPLIIITQQIYEVMFLSMQQKLGASKMPVCILRNYQLYHCIYHLIRSLNESSLISCFRAIDQSGVLLSHIFSNPMTRRNNRLDNTVSLPYFYRPEIAFLFFYRIPQMPYSLSWRFADPYFFQALREFKRIFCFKIFFIIVSMLLTNFTLTNSAYINPIPIINVFRKLLSM